MSWKNWKYAMICTMLDNESLKIPKEWSKPGNQRRTDNTIVKMTNCCHNSWVISYIYTGYKTLAYTSHTENWNLKSSHDNSAILCFALDNSYFYLLLSEHRFCYLIKQGCYIIVISICVFLR
jgi:hypothetical protein